jgi:hypothetical protein
VRQRGAFAPADTRTEDARDEEDKGEAI